MYLPPVFTKMPITLQQKSRQFTHLNTDRKFPCSFPLKHSKTLVPSVSINQTDKKNSKLHRLPVLYLTQMLCFTYFFMFSHLVFKLLLAGSSSTHSYWKVTHIDSLALCLSLLCSVLCTYYVLGLCVAGCFLDIFLFFQFPFSFSFSLLSLS